MKDTIAVTVDSDVAEYYRSTSDMGRRTVALLVNSYLRDKMALAKRQQEAEAARGPCWEAEQECLKAELIAKLGLDKVPETGKTLRETMSEMSRKAQERGLTWEILQSILNDE